MTITTKCQTLVRNATLDKGYNAIRFYIDPVDFQHVVDGTHVAIVPQIRLHIIGQTKDEYNAQGL